MLKTTNDYRSWGIDATKYTPEEVLEYVNSIPSWDNTEVKIIMIAFVDKVVSINGIPAFSGKDASAFTEIVKSFEYNSEGNRVAFIAYYADRDTAEVVYDSHPLDPCPRNTKHSGEEFAKLFEPIFNWWKNYNVEYLNESITEGLIQPTFN